MKTTLLLFASLCLSTLAGQNVLQDLIAANRGTFGEWAADPDKFEIQVLYSEIERGAEGSVRLKTHRWGARDTSQYFYPASSVKLPVAVLALQRLRELGATGLGYQTPLFHGTSTAPASAPQTPAYADPSSPTGLPTVEHYIRKIFLVSDNDAYNRLFEWLGPTYLNQALHRAGISGGRLQHRVGVSGFDTETHAWLNPVRFANGYETLFQVGERHDRYFDPLPQIKGQFRGRGYTNNAGDLVQEPFDFSAKNYLSVRNLHDILLRAVLPEAVPAHQRFQLDSADYALLRLAMGQRPRESTTPAYDKPDNYVKFWIYGDQPEETAIPKRLRIYNKVGWAYGYLTDAAYIVDAETGAEFILVGTIYVNDNGIFNDGVYEYATKGLPFFGELGRAVLDYERKKRR
ncbi:serine hydrolase [Neolewinella lacunae]|uniref:Serine hydrolase n=1 Tax=Neolewinella lacunae TaxID=1517758 RepID=A0A923T9K8_9BACT|nr:serine hydrolase [Neolewinella lacunae]MBC6995634.1 serine hydrolase [Neolewinella lacunae]MDN3634299.1 serine hydrolase [Neolewinella lacunae]